MTTTLTRNLQTALALGKTLTLFDESPSTGGSQSVKFAIESDSVLLSLYIGSTTGSVDVVAYTMAGDDTKETAVITFPTISSPTAELVLKKAAVVMGYLRVQITYTGSCDITVKARGIATGEASVRLLGQNQAKNYHTVIGTSPTLIIPIALADRVGIALHNTDGNKTIYMGFTGASTTTLDGWEIAPGEKLGLDIASGVSVYGLVLAGTATLKVLEAGS